MLIVMDPAATGGQIDVVVRAAEALGFTAQPMPGTHRTAIAIYW
jgi:hypothetical protein